MGGWGVGIAGPDLTAALGLEGLRGTLIYDVFRDSLAERGGLQPGDFVLEVGGQAVAEAMELVRAVSDQTPGRPASVTVVRQGSRMVIQVLIGLRPEASSGASPAWPGMRVVPVDAGGAGASREGVTVTDVSGTQAARAGLQRFDQATHINGQPVLNVMEFYRLVNDKEVGEFQFRVYRQGATLTIRVVR